MGGPHRISAPRAEVPPPRGKAPGLPGAREWALPVGPPGGSPWERLGQVLEPSSCPSPSPGASAVSPGHTSLFRSPSLGCSRLITVEVRGWGAGGGGGSLGALAGRPDEAVPPEPGADPEEIQVTDTDYASFALLLSRRQSDLQSILRVSLLCEPLALARSVGVGGGRRGQSTCPPRPWLKPGCAPRPPGRIWAIQTQLLDKFICLVRAQGLSDDNIVFPDLTGNGLLHRVGFARSLGALRGPSGSSAHTWSPSVGSQLPQGSA